MAPLHCIHDTLPWADVLKAPSTAMAILPIDVYASLISSVAGEGAEHGVYPSHQQLLWGQCVSGGHQHGGGAAGLGLPPGCLLCPQEEAQSCSGAAEASELGMCCPGVSCIEVIELGGHCPRMSCIVEGEYCGFIAHSQFACGIHW